jgi:hypothetical protein
MNEEKKLSGVASAIANLPAMAPRTVPEAPAPKPFGSPTEMARLLVEMGVPSTSMEVRYADMDFVVTVSRKEHVDAAEARSEAMRDALKHLSIIGERCDVRATARKGLGE